MPVVSSSSPGAVVVGHSMRLLAVWLLAVAGGLQRRGAPHGDPCPQVAKVTATLLGCREAIVKVVGEVVNGDDGKREIQDGLGCETRRPSDPRPRRCNASAKKGSRERTGTARTATRQGPDNRHMVQGCSGHGLPFVAGPLSTRRSAAEFPRAGWMAGVCEAAGAARGGPPSLKVPSGQ